MPWPCNSLSQKTSFACLSPPPPKQGYSLQQQTEDSLKEMSLTMSSESAPVLSVFLHLKKLTDDNARCIVDVDNTDTL